MREERSRMDAFSFWWRYPPEWFPALLVVLTFAFSIAAIILNVWVMLR